MMSDNRNAVHRTSMDEITLDTRLQFRQGTGPYGCDRDVIERYAQEMRDGTLFPPIEVVELSEAFEEYDAGTLLLVGGFTRFCAAKQAGLSELDTHVRPGSWNDARCLAFKQNATHGKPRSTLELKAVIAAIDEQYPGKSVREVAQMAGCSKTAVHQIRNPKPVDQPAPSKTKAKATLPAEDDEPEENEGERVPLGDEEVTMNWPSDVPREEEEEPEPERKPKQIDPYAELRADKREANAIASSLKDCLKRINDLKARPGGARIKFGVCEKSIEEARRHVQSFCPAVVLTDKAKEHITGKDPSDGQGWLHGIAADRLNEAARKECIDL